MAKKSAHKKGKNRGHATISERFDRLGRDGAPRRLGIMGGTFDPIHIGHLACAEQAREAFNLDAVIFIPTGNPAFKQDREVSAAHDRLAMCNLAVRPNPHFDTSDLEIRREGITYTVDTVRELREFFPPNVSLYFITGADSILSIARWRQSAVIAQHVTFIAVTRPGYDIQPSFLDELKQLGDYRVKFLEVTALSISSSYCRARVRAGYSLHYLTPLSVCDYIEHHGLYRMVSRLAEDEPGQEGTSMDFSKTNTCDELNTLPLAHDGCDPLSEEFYRARECELKKRVSEKRFHHIQGVADTAQKLARTYGLDERKARLAGLLHDWDKGYNDEEIRARVRELGLERSIDPSVVESMPYVLHGMTAAAALSRAYPEIPDEVISAIAYHTTASCDMSQLDMVVYIADAIEPSRQFGRIDELRSYVGTMDLEELFIETYGYWVSLLMERKRLINPDTVSVWNTYVARRNKNKHK